MFFRKRRKLLERISALEDKLSRQQGQIDLLIKEVEVVGLNVNEYIEVLEESGRHEDASTLLRMKMAYEKRLKRFIRKTRRPLVDN